VLSSRVITLLPLLLTGWISASILVVDHAEKYVDEHVHSNGLETFWCPLKRGIGDT
jgi:hypothetical protein